MIKKKNANGQAMVEWALVAPLVILSIFAMCQWCMIEVAHTLTINAAQNAARAELVGEDAFEAAGISLLPVAGWTDNLVAEGQNGEEFILSAEAGKGLVLPGWSSDRAPLNRGRFLYNRLIVETERDWEAATAEVTFYCELIFPFVDVLFADISSKQEVANGGDTEDKNPGISRFQETTTTDLSARNFVELKARASVPQVGRPFDTNINFDASLLLGIEESDPNVVILPLITRGPINWTPRP